jgi:hypothetical protein
VKILFLCHKNANYVPDLLLHGLRKLAGSGVVDYPRKDGLYEGMLGQPFLEKIPNLMPDDADVDRSDITAKMRRGFFDLVICDIRALEGQLDLLNQSTCPLALLDGEDQPFALPAGRFVTLRRETIAPDPAQPLPMGLPVEVMDWIDRHADTPKTHSIGFLGSRSHLTPDRNAFLDELARLFPDSLVEAWQYSGTGWKGRDAYYSAMQSCKIVLNLPGAGYDTFRYWENAACNAAHVAKAMPIVIPNDFRDGEDILRFSNFQELVDAVEKILSHVTEWQQLAANSREWLKRHHTTERRAQATLDGLRARFAQ